MPTSFKHPTLRAIDRWVDGEYEFTRTGPAEVQFSDLRANPDGSFDLVFIHPVLGPLPFTARDDPALPADDPARLIHAMIVAGELGEPGPGPAPEPAA